MSAFDRPLAPVRRADWLPLVDIRENETEYQIDVEVPAVASEDLAVSVADGVLTVSGERKSVEPAEGVDERVHRVERRYGRFVRNFQLPEDADFEAISAESRDGVLYLKIAKRASATPKEIEVKIS
jgi:HSP20 family protein